jgi:hypothetical protein
MTTETTRVPARPTLTSRLPKPLQRPSSLRYFITSRVLRTSFYCKREKEPTSAFVFTVAQTRRKETHLVILLILILTLALSLNESRGDAVKITLAVLRDATSTTGGILLKDTNLLEGLEDLACYG